MKKIIPVHMLLSLDFRRTKAIKPEVSRWKEIESNRIKKIEKQRKKEWS